MSDNCLFCKIVRREIPADIVMEDDRILAFRDANPQAPVHALVIPKEHIPTVNDLAPENNDLVGHIVQSAKALAAKMGVAEEGYRLVFNCNALAGQTIYHIHLHLLAGRPMKWPPG